MTSTSSKSTARSRLWRIVVPFLLFLLMGAVWFTWEASRASLRNQLANSLRADGYMLSYGSTEQNWLSTRMGVNPNQTIVGIDGYHLRHIGAKRLRRLAALESLQRLQIAINHADEATFEAIENLSKLEFLVLSTPPFPKEYVRHLAELHKLENLYITQPIGDSGIAWLCRLKNLQTLTISSDGLTQEGIQQLATLKTLTFLKLHGTLDVSSDTRSVLRNVVIDDGSFHRNKRRMIKVSSTSPVAPE